MSYHTELALVHERILVVQAQARDPHAFRELVTRYERRLLYYIRRLLGDGEDAFDVMQDVWLLVFRKLNLLRSPEAFRVWLYKIAHDVTVSQLRKQSKWPQPLTDEQFGNEFDAWNELEALENAALVHRSLERLSPPHREVLTLRFLEGLDHSEIAEVVGCGIGTVKSRLHYAKRELRTQLQQLEGSSHV